MTAAARISQADIQRATRAAFSVSPRARVVLDLDARRIEIIIEDTPAEPRHVADKSVWSDDDF